MRELELAVHPSIDPTRLAGGRSDFPLSRMAFAVSIAAHVIAAYALLQHRWIDAPAPPAAAEFFLFELPAPRPEPVPGPAVAPLPISPQIEERAPAPLPSPVEVVPEPAVVVEEPVTRREPVPTLELAPAPTDLAPGPALEVVPAPSAFIDFDEERRRAANQVIGSRADEKEYLTFSIDDVAPPRPKPEPDAPSIFDGGAGGPRGPNVGQLGQARTRVGQKASALCNALTGGFSLMGWGSFCAGPSDGGPSGLFPEVRPAYLDLMPECVDTRDTAPALALEAPFPTIKCRLVKQEEAEQQP